MNNDPSGKSRLIIFSTSVTTLVKIALPLAISVCLPIHAATAQQESLIKQGIPALDDWRTDATISNFFHAIDIKPLNEGAYLSIKSILDQPCGNQLGILTKPYLKMVPNLRGARVKNGRVTLPFLITNNDTEDIIVTVDVGRGVSLLTTDSSRKKVGLNEFMGQTGYNYSGPGPYPVYIKPGETVTLPAEYPIDTLAFFNAQNKEVFGGIVGLTPVSHQVFYCYSSEFSIPENIPENPEKPPWNDLGETNYLSIMPDVKLCDIIVEKDHLSFSVCITNISNQPLIVAEDEVRWYLEREISGGGKYVWDIDDTRGKILKPGESANTARQYLDVTFNSLRDKKYKHEDAFVVYVGGLIPDSNRIFECRSAPFKLPVFSLPTPHSTH